MGKQLIIPDVHLGYFSKRRDTPRLQFLLERITDPSVERVILLGDFWDSWLIPWNLFIMSGWKELFPELKRKHTVYIKGNHDRHVPNHLRLFWEQTSNDGFKIKQHNRIFTLIHGHTFDSMKHLDTLIEWNLARLFYPLTPWLQERAIARGAASRMWQSYKKWNEEQKHKISRFRKPNETIITGHTHLAEEDRARGYINAGHIGPQLKRASYVLIDRGTAKLIRNFIPSPNEQ